MDDISKMKKSFEDLSYDMINSLLDAGFVCMEKDFSFSYELEGQILVLYGKRGDWINLTDNKVINFKK